MNPFEDLRFSLKVIHLILFTSVFIFSYCDFICERKNYAEDLIQKVEKYKSINKRLPNDISELKIIENENSMAYYMKINENEYEIWFAKGFESVIYNTKTKKWREEG